MGSVICITTAPVVGSLFESSLSRAIELFFFFFFFIAPILVSYIVNYYKYVFNYYKYILYSLYTL